MVGSEARAVDEFRQNCNRASFMFAHTLHKHPLFELDSLVELARRRQDKPEFIYWSNGAVNVGDHWGKGADGRISLLDTLSNIEANDSLVMLYRIELDPVFAPVLKELLADVMDLAGPHMREDALIGRATILVASSRRITAYHIDGDVNFLFQIRGEKSISIFDQTDRTLITEEELERYYSGHLNAAVFKEARQKEAKVYDLRPGVGVHIPCTAPHWAQTRDDVSIALSLNYDMRSIRRSASVYRLNFRLRRLGVPPAAPGQSRWKDQAKIVMNSAISTAIRIARPKHSTDHHKH
jgi:hypothetical protein